MKLAEAARPPRRALAGTIRPADLRLISGFALEIDGAPVALPLSAQRVIAFVALSDGPVGRTLTAERLWLDESAAHALGSLRSALWRLRRAGVELLDCANGRLALDGHVEVDVHAVLAWSHRQLDGALEGERAEDVAHVRATCELLPDWYDDWVVLERERLREVRARALERLCERLTDEGRFHRAGEAGLAAVRSDPLRESAHRCLIRVHLAEGNDAEAMRRYHGFRKLLLDECGLLPTARMEALIATVTSA